MSEKNRKRVFITGGASGLGLALAMRYSREGWRVAVADINDERCKAACAEIDQAGGESLAVHCDIRVDAEVGDAADVVAREWGGLDVLVNNAGVAAAGTLLDTSMEDWRWMIDINLLGAIRVSKAFVPIMKGSSCGHVINVASVAGIAQCPGMASYNVAKAGMIALSETLKNELKPLNIGVTVVCPSFFVTNLLESYKGDESGARDVASRLMKRSKLTADDIAEAVWRGMQRNDFFVFGHNEARFAYHFKRLFPGMFSVSTHKVAERMFAGMITPASETADGE
ncbi:MAG: SDR family oxidoreductase [Gammaproteobacteria bacterium]